MVLGTTIRDLARRTGYSTATVSLALRGHPRIPVTTRETIRRVARELGYRPDPVLASIASHRWRRRAAPAGSTLAGLSDGTLTGGAGLAGGEGMAERARSLGYGFEVFRLRDYPSTPRLCDVLHSRGILGLVVGQIFTPGFCAAFDWSRFAVVACGEGFVRPPVNLVMPDHFGAIQAGWDRAWARGCRRIGLALFELPAAIDYHERCAAFLERQSRVATAHRVPVLGIRPHLSGAGDGVEAADAEAMAAWLDRWQPDVVLGFNDAFRWMVLHAGRRIPEDVAFLNLWINTPGSIDAGFVLHLDELGHRAVDWLDAQLRRGERGVPERVGTLKVELSWQDGPSLPARTRASRQVR